MDKRKIKISKLDAARRQLDTAIRLYFMDRDPVSIHTLACAAFEILKDLDKHGPKTGTYYDRIPVNVKPEYQKLVLNLFRKPQNFFKHATKDPRDVLEFSLAQPEFFLASACDKYKELAAEQSAEMFVYWTWFTLQNPEALTPSGLERIGQFPSERKYRPDQRLEFFTKYIQLTALAMARETSNPLLKPRSHDTQ